MPTQAVRCTVAAGSRYGHRVAQPPGGLDEHRVPGVVPAYVVDRGEAVQVDDEHRARLAGYPAQDREPVQQLLAVGQAGELVRTRQPVQAALQLPPLAHVAYVYHERPDLGHAAQIAHRGLGVPPVPEAVAQPGLDEHAAAELGAGLGEDGGQPLAYPAGVVRVYPGQERPAHHVLVGQAELARRGRRLPPDGEVGVEHHGDLRGARDQ
jgi:hypothetical protein